jgi:hypothetical protein
MPLIFRGERELRPVARALLLKVEQRLGLD